MFLSALFIVWLFPEWLGLSGGRPTWTVDGAAIAVRDGDTLTFAKQNYRLYGIDAPEYNQSCKTAAGSSWPCGRQARAELVALIDGRKFTCEERARDKYGRIVATCRDDRGSDIARSMIERGFAVSFGGFGQSLYAADEAIAKTAQRGLWQGAFEPPASWRATHPHPPFANR